ncbi:MAG: alcohol dehydrogenase catalytic domain-containing protein [Clostridia bacterium]|nr:alcohol dehydrogenase catalytic domain-containing protein [Clostridia bacterium]
MKAKAAVFTAPNTPFEVREFDVTATPPGFGRSELIASGVCGTDLHIFRGKLDMPVPSIIGHEFVGKLTDCDPAEAAKYGLKKGDNVIADIAVPCGKCLLCRTGDDANCVNMRDTNSESIDKPPYLYGGYAEVNYTPLTNLLKIPEGVDPKAAAVFGCPGPTIIHSVRLARRAGCGPGPETTAVVQGLGPVGCFAAVYFKALGVKKIYAVGAHDNPGRADLLKKLGADEVLSLEKDGEDAITDKILSENDGLGADLCAECSGAPSALTLGMNVLRNRGLYLIPGQYSSSGNVSIPPEVITFKALRFIGSSQYSVIDVLDYLEFMRAHKELEKTVISLGSFYSVSDVNAAFKDALTGKNIKTLLVK